MKQFILFISIVLFSIFIGSQITEGVLLVPYWQSLSREQFYSYYNEFGPSIGLFYTILTITAAFIPIAISIYCKIKNLSGLKYALFSSCFAILFVFCFYIYFKGTNELFYQSALSNIDLRLELVTWSYWHWGRIFIECISLYFLILSVIQILNNRLGTSL